MAGFYSARSSIMPPLPWPTFAPPLSIEAGLRHLAGPQQIGGGKAGARTFQAKTGEAVEDDLGEIVPVADQVCEDTDKKRLLDEACDDVVIRTPGPEECGQRHVDDD